MSKNILVVLVVLFVSAAALNAQQSVSADVAFLSGYMTQHGALLCDSPSVQVDVTIPVAHGAYVDLWADQALNKANNEVDWTVGWARGGMDVKAAFFQLNPAGSKNTTFYFATAYAMPVRHLGRHAYWMYAQANYLRPSFQRTTNAGTWLRVGATDAFIVGRATVTQNAWLMRDNGVFGGASGYILRYEPSITFRRGAYKITPLAKVSLPLTSMSDRERQVIVGVGFGRAWNK